MDKVEPVCKAKLGHDFNLKSGKCRHCPHRAAWAPKPRAWSRKIPIYRPYTPRSK